MRILLRDLSPGQQYAIQFRSNDGVGNVSDWSQVQRFTTTNDTMPPANVLNLTWFDSGPSFIAQWDKVSTNVDGSALKDFRCYHVQVTNGITVADYWPIAEHFEFTAQMNTAQFGTFQNHLTVLVTAVDLTHNESPNPATLTADPLNPPTPYAPTVGNYLGLLTVNWNGKASDGTAMVSNFDHCEVHVSTTNLFTPSAATQAGTLLQMDGTAKIVLSGYTYGTTYYVRLIAVNKMGKKSGPSDQASGTPASITGLDIQNGQIAAEQINWAATKIPGGNAYYKTSQPTLADAVGGAFSTQDIWYDTDDGYAPYRWTGTTWASASDVGFIAGQKIIAGTITADKVGTNFLIAAKAKIGQAWIDAADIQTVNAGSITAGIMQSAATNTYGGVSQPAWSLDLNGNAVLNTATVYGSITLGKSTNTTTQNSAATIQSYNYAAGSAGWAIKGDGSVEFVNGTFRGQLFTGFANQRHTEIVNGGVSAVNFYSATNVQSYVRAYTENSTGQETIQIGMPVANSDSLWNRLNINSAQYSLWRSGVIEFTVAAANLTYSGFGGGFRVFNTTNQTAGQTNSAEMFGLDSNGTTFWTPTFQVNGLYNGYFNVAFNNLNWGSGSSNGVRMVYGNGGGSFNVFQDQNVAYAGPRIQVFNGSNYGMSLGFWYNPADGNGAGLEVKDWAYSNWYPIRASAFNVISDERTKTNVRPADTSAMLDNVMSMKVKRYHRTDHQGNPGPHEEIGFLAHELPDQLIHANPQGEALKFVDLYQTVTHLYGALQEAVTEYRREIDNLKKRNHDSAV